MDPQYVLLIGVDAYPNWPGRDLLAPCRDIDDWKNVCVNVDRNRAPALVVLRSWLAGDPATTADPPADFATITKELDRLQEWLAGTPGGEAVIVFCGHGDVDVDEDDRVRDTFLCPSDIDNPGGAPQRRISIARFVEACRKVAAPQTSLTLFLDACFSGQVDTAAQRDDAHRSEARLKHPDRCYPDDNQPHQHPQVPVPTLRGLRQVSKSGARHAARSFGVDAKAGRQRLRVVMHTASSVASWEFQLADRWRGMFSWAATHVLARWGFEALGGDVVSGITHLELEDRMRALMRAMDIPQRPTFFPQSPASRYGDHRVFQDLAANPGGVEAPPFSGVPTEISGGNNADWEFGIMDGTTRLGTLYIPAADRTNADGQTFIRNREYWQISPLPSASFRIEILSTSASVPGGTDWRESTTVSSGWSTTARSLASPNLYRATGSGAPSGGSPDIQDAYVKFDPTNDRVIWSRSKSADLFAGHGAGAYISFSPHASYSSTAGVNRYWNDDTFTPV